MPAGLVSPELLTQLPLTSNSICVCVCVVCVCVCVWCAACCVQLSTPRVSIASIIDPCSVRNSSVVAQLTTLVVQLALCPKQITLHASLLPCSNRQPSEDSEWPPSHSTCIAPVAGQAQKANLETLFSSAASPAHNPKPTPGYPEAAPANQHCASGDPTRRCIGKNAVQRLQTRFLGRFCCWWLGESDQRRKASNTEFLQVFTVLFPSCLPPCLPPSPFARSSRRVRVHHSLAPPLGLLPLLLAANSKRRRGIFALILSSWPSPGRNSGFPVGPVPPVRRLRWLISPPGGGLVGGAQGSPGRQEEPQCLRHQTRAENFRRRQPRSELRSPCLSDPESSRSSPGEALADPR